MYIKVEVNKQKKRKKEKGQHAFLYKDMICFIPVGIYMFKVNNRNTVVGVVLVS